MSRLDTTFFAQAATAIILVVLIGVSFYLRTVNISERVRWDYDRSRDLLTSYHIWMYDDHPLLGHHASGFHTHTLDGYPTILKYPPWYYYYLSLFWKIGRTLDGFLYVNAAIFSLSVATMYSIATQMSNRKAGLLSAAVFALSLKYVDSSRIIIGLQVGMPMYLLAAALFIRSLKKRSRPINVLSLTLLVSSVSFHYSVLIPFSVLFFVSELSFNKKIAERLISSLVYGTYYVTLFFFLHIPVISFFGLPLFLVRTPSIT